MCSFLRRDNSIVSNCPQIRQDTKVSNQKSEITILRNILIKLIKKTIYLNYAIHIFTLLL